MNFKDLQAQYEIGNIPFCQIGRCAKVCSDDDDFIQYVNLCFRFIESCQSKLDLSSVYSEDFCIELASISKDLLQAHAVIEHCHNYLSGKWKPVAKSSYENYMYNATREKTK